MFSGSEIAKQFKMGWTKLIYIYINDFGLASHLWELLYSKIKTANSSQCELPKLTNIGSCGLHIFHGAFKSGDKATSWELKEILKSAFTLLHGSPAQRDYFTSHSV